MNLRFACLLPHVFGSLCMLPDLGGCNDLGDCKVFPCTDWPARLNPDNISELALGCFIVSEVVLERFVCLLTEN